MIVKGLTEDIGVDSRVFCSSAVNSPRCGTNNLITPTNKGYNRSPRVALTSILAANVGYASTDHGLCDLAVGIITAVLSVNDCHICLCMKIWFIKAAMGHMHKM